MWAIELVDGTEAYRNGRIELSNHADEVVFISCWSYYLFLQSQRSRLDNMHLLLC